MYIARAHTQRWGAIAGLTYIGGKKYKYDVWGALEKAGLTKSKWDFILNYYKTSCSDEEYIQMYSSYGLGDGNHAKYNPNKGRLVKFVYSFFEEGDETFEAIIKEPMAKSTKKKSVEEQAKSKQAKIKEHKRTHTPEHVEDLSSVSAIPEPTRKEKCAFHMRPMCDVCATHVRPMCDPCATHVRPTHVGCMCDPCGMYVRPMCDPCAMYVHPMCDPCAIYVRPTHVRRMCDLYSTHPCGIYVRCMCDSPGSKRRLGGVPTLQPGSMCQSKTSKDSTRVC